MSSTFVELTQDKLNASVAEFLCPRIQNIISGRAPGHCMRIADLDNDVMESICAELRRQHPEDNIYILGSHDQENDSNRITSTKLVELRNPQADGQLRPPLLVFIPTSLRTSAEDSFGIATFEELTFAGIYDELVEELFKRVPASLVGHVFDIFSYLNEESWPYSDDDSKVRYLLTALENGIDGETLGASLYVLSLIPDFRLFEDPSLVNGKIHRNLECVERLMNSYKSVRGRIAALSLSDKALANRLAHFFDQYDIQEPEIWTRAIAVEKGWWPISFDKWSFTEELVLEKIDLTVKETDLPVVQVDEKDDVLAGLVGQQVLNPNERRKLNVVFEVSPHPKKVNGLDHFTVQIMSQAGGLIGKSKKVKAWAPKRTHCTTSLTKLNKIDFEEGWHYIRVLPWTAEGDPIPLADGLTSNGSAIRSFESEPFYVLQKGSIEEDPPQRAIPYEKSLSHAWFKLQLTAIGDGRDPSDINISGVNWAESKSIRKTSKRETLIVKFGREGSFQVPVSRTLKNIEQRILAEPKHPSGWRMQINVDSPEPPSEVGLILPSSGAMHSFLSAREELFNAIRQVSSELISQGFAFKANKNLCVSYAETFLDLIRSLMRLSEQTSGSTRQTHLQELRNILAVDSVHVILTDFRGKHRECVLISPTHPLRILWFLGWAILGQKWIEQLTATGKEYLTVVRSALLDGMQAANFPVGIPVDDGRVFTPVDDLNPFWSLYAPTTEDNTRGLLAEVCAALGLSEPASAGVDFSGAVLADKIDRYLTQHPYVRQLSINVFNPGAGTIIADALISLQQKREYASMRYDLRLFSSDPESPLLGEALESILNAGSAHKIEAADAFAASTGNHLFSKLTLAKHSFEEFHNDIKKYAAHVSIMLDVFPAEELSVKETFPGQVPLYGLIQDHEINFIDDDSGTFWQKSPVIGSFSASEPLDACFDFLPLLSSKICAATSAVATSGVNFNAVPVITLGLNFTERELIYQIHQVSDWVFTVDRNMGIEFFDHGGKKNRPDYLIDFVPGTSSHAVHNLIISSRSTDELEAMLKPVLLSHGLTSGKDQAVAILTCLRSLSGQLALKLISGPTQQSEALGLALARLYLEYQGALSNQVIVPLDAHYRFI